MHKQPHRKTTKPTTQRTRSTTTKPTRVNTKANPRRTIKRTKHTIITNNVYDSFSDLVGNTPLVKLKAASEATGCNIYGKCEFMNPGGSVKDRAAKFLINEAEERGVLTPGKPGIICESSAGNTAIGLALYGNSRGYRTVAVIPKTQTEEKKAVIRACGVYLVESEALPFANPGNYVHVGRRLSILLKKALPHIPVVHTNQWDNQSNAKAHIETTAVELIAQMKAAGLQLDGFSCAVGTGGTLAGTSMGLKAQLPNVKVALTDPQGTSIRNYFTTGQMTMSPGSSITEGIGQNRLTGNLALAGFKPDFSFEVDDATALKCLNQLNYEEGLQVGLSSGINVAGAMMLARELGPGKNLVTILADNAMRYASKMYNIPFLNSKGLPTPYWMDPAMVMADGAVNREEFAIGQDVNLLPEMMGGINIEQLAKEAIENHSITE